MTDQTAERPARRSTDLIVQASGDDVVVYAQDTDQVSVLTGVDAEVWSVADGSRTLEEMSESLARPEEEVATSLAKLEDSSLLAAPLSRRIALKRMAVVGGGVALAGVLAPMAHAAASTTPPPPTGPAVTVSFTIKSGSFKLASGKVTGGKALTPFFVKVVANYADGTTKQGFHLTSPGLLDGSGSSAIPSFEFTLLGGTPAPVSYTVGAYYPLHSAPFATTTVPA